MRSEVMERFSMKCRETNHRCSGALGSNPSKCLPGWNMDMDMDLNESGKIG